MADQRVVARYAKSLLDLGKEMGTLSAVKADMDLLTKTMAESRDLRLLLRNPIVKHDKKLAILKAIFEGKVSDMTLRFFTILTDKNRESAIEGIGPEFLGFHSQAGQQYLFLLHIITPVNHPAIRCLPIGQRNLSFRFQIL